MTVTDYTLALELPKGKKGVKGRSITQNERDVLLRVLRGHRGEIFCKFILYCGLRPGEVAALLWKDMVLKNMLGWLADSESSFLMKRKH